MTDNLACPRIVLPDTFEAYLAALGRNTRQKIRRLLRMLDAGEFNIRPGGSSVDVERIASLWVERWRSLKGSRMGDLQDDLRRILSGRPADGGAIRPDPRAQRHHARRARQLCGHGPRRDLFLPDRAQSEAKDASVGLLLHSAAIRAAIEEGFRVYDFLRGDEPYKLQLGGVPERIHFPIVRRPTAAAPREILAPASAPAVLRRVERMIAEGDPGAAAAVAQLRAVLQHT